MTILQELNDFQKMWTWLSSHPAHDQNYYIQHVIRLDTPWKNSCPLCHTDSGKCRECDPLWQSDSGGLCDDQDSPLSRWQQTSIHDPDNRTWFANRVSLLAMRAIRSRRQLEQSQTEHA
ncbi:hypothetical protein [Desulfosediminicola sp.]|uniref:hypothetical protein n=1 Tax=Desulfosediminicola sp. TaxID=2886825 RepID=UPI003AF2D607